MSELELAKIKLIDTIGKYNLTASNIAKFQFSRSEENLFANMMVEFANELTNEVSENTEEPSVSHNVSKLLLIFYKWSMDNETWKNNNRPIEDVNEFLVNHSC